MGVAQEAEGVANHGQAVVTRDMVEVGIGTSWKLVYLHCLPSLRMDHVAEHLQHDHDRGGQYYRGLRLVYRPVVMESIA